MSVQGPNRKGPQGNPDLDALGCSHFQCDDAPWAAQHKKLAVYPLVSCKGTVGLLGLCRWKDLGADGFMLSCGYWDWGPLRKL